MKILVLSYMVILRIPTMYSVILEYPTDIASFSFIWGNPEWTNSTLSGPINGSLLTNGDIDAGQILDNPSTQTDSWGKQHENTPGITGIFYADTLSPGIGFSHWDITAAKITFAGNGCFGNHTEATFAYQDIKGITYKNTTDVIMSVETAKSYIHRVTFTAALKVTISTNGAVGFNIASNLYCQSVIKVLEFELNGTRIAIDEPTKPSEAKTPENDGKHLGSATIGSMIFATIVGALLFIGCIVGVCFFRHQLLGLKKRIHLREIQLMAEETTIDSQSHKSHEESDEEFDEVFDEESASSI